MKEFVEWFAARRYRMVLLATALIMAALSHPRLAPLSVFGQAVIVFAVLLRGVHEGVRIAALVAALLVLPWLLTGANATATMAIGLALWLLPPLLLAMLLERTRSISLTTQTATVGVAVLVVLYFVFGSPLTVADEIIAQLGGLGEVSDEVKAQASRMLTGLVAGALLIWTLAAVYMGRWWQATVSNPGAFGKEFRGLRMGTVVGVVAGIVFLATGLTRIPLLENLTSVLATGFLLHGLAVLHSMAAAGMTGFWLGAVYVLLFVAFPFAELAVAALGFIDNWFDLRSRLARR